MDQTNELKQRIYNLEYRLRIIEKFLDSNGLIRAYKGEKNDMNAIRISVLNDMRHEIKDLRIEFDKSMGLNFYHKGK